MKRLYGFSLLPLIPGSTADALVAAVERVAGLPHLRGIIMGTRGLGKGLDNDALEPAWAAIEKAGLVVFLHPHYGVDKNAWGEWENGHVLPLALGSLLLQPPLSLLPFSFLALKPFQPFGFLALDALKPFLSLSFLALDALLALLPLHSIALKAQQPLSTLLFDLLLPSMLLTFSV